MDGRVMVRDRYGFKVNKDETPPTWHIKNARELRTTSNEELSKEAMWVSGMRGLGKTKKSIKTQTKEARTGPVAQPG